MVTWHIIIHTDTHAHAQLQLQLQLQHASHVILGLPSEGAHCDLNDAHIIALLLTTPSPPQTTEPAQPTQPAQPPYAPAPRNPL